MSRFLSFVALSLSCLTLTGFLQCQGQPECEPGGASNNPLVRAIVEGDWKKARAMIRSKESLDTRDQCGVTPLLAAINGGNDSEFANELLSAGADPKFPDGGAEALLGAAYYCNLKVAQELLKRGVSVNIASGNRETPLMEAPSQRCKDGEMVQLLLDMGADPNARDRNGFSALLAASMTGDAAGAERLLKAGADPTFKDKYGNTPESQACDRGEKGHSQVCTLVRQALVKK